MLLLLDTLRITKVKTKKIAASKEMVFERKVFNRSNQRESIAVFEFLALASRAKKARHARAQ
jgi:hypothetical protein